MAKSYERYLFEYRFQDAEWAFEIVATSPEEARERLKAISWAQYKGHIFAKIAVTGGSVSRTLFRVKRALGLG
jgi:hypothetical protein